MSEQTPVVAHRFLLGHSDFDLLAYTSGAAQMSRVMNIPPFYLFLTQLFRILLLNFAAILRTCMGSPSMIKDDFTNSLASKSFGV